MGLLRRLRPFLTHNEKLRVAAAIARAEKQTTGEIHVHLTTLAAPAGILGQAERLFASLGLHKTKARNGVLVLVAVSDRRFAIWGDSGIHQAAGQPFWDKARAALESKLREGHACAALEACVEEVGRALAAHFPPDGSDDDELSNDVTED